jgi:hypothetical protein
MSLRNRWARHVVLATALAGVAGLAAEPTATVDRVWPVSPQDGAVVGPRTLFEIAYDGVGDPHPRDLRFRIRIEPVRDHGESYVFDQRRRRAGWLVGEPGRMLYRPRKPLADGTYRWEAAVWHGVDWMKGPGRHEIRVDSVAPADIDELRVRRDPRTGRTMLDWDPVTLDRDGRPEFVARYHVYRYERGSPIRRVRVHEIATVVQPGYVDAGASENAARVLFYRVTAEDEAGNEGGPD